MDAGLDASGGSVVELDRKLTTLNLATAGRDVVPSSPSSITPVADSGSEIFEKFPRPASQLTCEDVSADDGTEADALVAVDSLSPASGGADSGTSSPDIVEEDGEDDGVAPIGDSAPDIVEEDGGDGSAVPLDDSAPDTGEEGIARGVEGVVGGAAAGALAASTVGTVALNAAGFTAVGPAAGSCAAAWMSSIATANGVGVVSGSVFSVLQATAMSGGLLIGSPLVLLAGAAAGVRTWRRWRKAPAPAG